MLTKYEEEEEKKETMIHFKSEGITMNVPIMTTEQFARAMRVEPIWINPINSITTAEEQIPF